MRTDAKNLVTTASTTHLPEQKETIHMISMLRKEACSGNINDLAHVASLDCLSDALTKSSANPDIIMKSIETGILPKVDSHPNFRTLMSHKAYLIQWYNHFSPKKKNPQFLGFLSLIRHEQNKSKTTAITSAFY